MSTWISSIVYAPILARHYLGIVARRTYRLDASAAPLPPVAPPLGIDEIDPPAFAFVKPLTDVLLLGGAYARDRPATFVDTALRCGAARKPVRVHGDRTILEGASGALAFSTAAPFERKAIGWDNAYGGRDERVEAALRDEGLHKAPFGLDLAWEYPRNRAGRGFHFEGFARALVGTAAPDCEDPTDAVTPERLGVERITRWIDAPIAAAYAPIDLFTFPRAHWLIPPAFDAPARPPHEVAYGALLARDVDRPLDPTKPPDPRVFQCAPTGLAVCRLAGDEPAQLWNLHRDHAMLDGRLPGDKPRLLLDVPGVGTEELAPRLSTVLFEPDEDRVTLTWGGAIEVAMPYPDDVIAGMRHAVTWSRA
jgi:hypothetical protein